MSNILVITDRIPPEHSATGRFMYHIANELGKNGKVYLVCLSDTKNQTDSNVKVIKVLSRYGKYKLLTEKAENKKNIAKIFYKIWYHVYYKYAVKKGLSEIADHKKQILKICKKTIKTCKIDIIISSSNPFENHVVAYKLVKKFKRIKWFPYLMDSARNNAVKPVSRDTELNVFSLATNILIVPAITFDQGFIKDFSDKIQLVYLPIIPVKRVGVKRNDDKIVFIYAGMFYKEIRNPENLFKIFTLLPSNYELHLYCNGCNDETERYKAVLGSRLRVSGFISEEELTEKINGCDILINVCNSVINQIASKIYDMIAYGKPLLNFYQDDKDLTIEHVNKYELSFNAEYSSSDNNIKKIIDWCELVKGKECSYNEATKSIPDKRLSEIVAKINKIINV